MTIDLQEQQFQHANGFPRYSEGEMSRRHQALREMMERHDLDAVVVGGATGVLETSVQYFTNWPPLVESYLVFPRDAEPALLVRLWNHIPDAERIAVISDVRYGGDTPGEQAANVAATLKATSNASAVGLIGPVRHADMLIFQETLPDTRWVDLMTDYRELRLVKSEEELTYTRIASVFNDRAVEAMEQKIKPGMKEYEIAKIIEDVYLAERGVNLIHFTLSTPMEDPQVCVPHQYHPDRTIEVGDVIVTEISTTLWGYAGQILRSFTVAADPTPMYQEMHDIAVAAYDSIVGVMKEGATIGEILDAAENVEEAGYSIWDDLVHGFGGAYLPPIIRTRQTRGSTHPEDYAYKAGTVLVVQPNVITKDNKAGVQVGNSLQITPDGVEVLQKYPMRFLRCG